MFDELPETIPHKNKKKLEAIAGAAAIQVALVAAIIIIQMALPAKLGDLQLLQTLYMAPPPPPPAVSAAPQPVRSKPVKAVSAASTEPQPVVQPRPVEEEPKVVAPTTIPKDIARIIESGPPSRAASAGGVPGGVPGGVTGGVFGGVLGGAAVTNVTPPPATAPVRVGGNVKQPKVIHMEQPRYPIAAKQAHIEGVVVVEATVTADGTVEKVKAVSGPAQLQEAATDAVSRWRYEPTYLNGQAVPVILTARITFSLGGGQQ